MANNGKPVIGITMGDPAGIGSEIIVKAYDDIFRSGLPVVIGDANVMQAAVEICDSNYTIRSITSIDKFELNRNEITVFDLNNVDSLEYGIVDEAYGQASLEYIEQAILLAQNGDIDVITTAPINKQSTQLAGSTYAGHTGMLADYTDTDNYSMMLIEERLRVTHVSTHVALRDACDIVTPENVLDTIRVTDEALRTLGIDSPTITVAGLNPHASDGGLLGDEDFEEIEPAVRQAQEEGIDVSGPESPDTVYVQAVNGMYDCVVSMYHDQGHIPIKMVGFSKEGGVSGVNMTIGLPIIRTSVDHGTAFDIAGEGIASEKSLIDAVQVGSTVAQGN